MAAENRHTDKAREVAARIAAELGQRPASQTEYVLALAYAYAQGNADGYTQAMTDTDRILTEQERRS